MDLMIFASIIRGEKELNEYKAMTMKGLEIAEKLYKLATAGAQKQIPAVYYESPTGDITFSNQDVNSEKGNCYRHLFATHNLQ